MMLWWIYFRVGRCALWLIWVASGTRAKLHVKHNANQQYQRLRRKPCEIEYLPIVTIVLTRSNCGHLLWLKTRMNGHRSFHQAPLQWRHAKDRPWREPSGLKLQRQRFKSTWSLSWSLARLSWSHRDLSQGRDFQVLFEWIGSVVGRGRFSSTAYKLGESVSDQAWKWVQPTCCGLARKWS